MPLTLKIEKLVYGGYGLARTGSGVVFVRYVLPGEVVDAVIESKANGSRYAFPQKVLESSPARREPRCRYSGECGGCDWLYIDYNEQLRCKKEIFEDCFRRIGKLEIPEPQLFHSPEFAYRIRAQIKVSEKCAGFFMKKTNSIVNISDCPLLSDSLNSLLKNDLAGILKPEKVLNLKVISGEKRTASFPVLKGLTFDKTEIRTGGNLFEVNGDSFFQSNQFLLEQMGLWAINDAEGGRCVDLYGGVGFFSVMLGKKFDSLILVESQKENISEASRNFALNGLSNCKAIHGEVENVAGSITSEPDFLIIDPPRPGLTRKAREAVFALRPEKILYISCNPSTQARDVQYFTKQCGYKICKSALFDLYPNTHHLETAILLQRH